MKPDLTLFLGRRVLVRVDRPQGSRHPRHPDLAYPVNYGFVPGTLSGDGQPVDAYLLDVNEPVGEAAGVVVALIVRENDAEDKLVVAPDGAAGPFTEAAVRAAVDFQERFFDAHIVLVPIFPEKK
jgi:inorganic pyrophosphatase